MGTPKFDNPPVVETIIGVHFSPVRKIRNAHLGLFWRELGSENWPSIDEASLVEPDIERFDEGLPLNLRNISFQVATKGIPNRLRIWNRDQDRMIQIQNDVLRYNWLGHKEEKKYPEFDNVKPEFDKSLSKLNCFIDKNKLGEIQPIQWEIVYINHLEKDTVWRAPQDLGSVFPGLLGSLPPISTTDTPLESMSGQWCYVIGEQKGRLRIGLRHARKAKNQEVIVFSLTARGPASNEQEIHEGIELGHETIVRAFKELTSPEAHQYWQLRND